MLYPSKSENMVARTQSVYGLLAWQNIQAL